MIHVLHSIGWGLLAMVVLALVVGIVWASEQHSPDAETRGNVRIVAWVVFLIVFFVTL